MEAHRKELLVARIASGMVRIRLPDLGQVLCVHRPTREQAYIAQEIYEEQLVEGHLQGLFAEDELLDWMYDHELWDEDRQKKLDGLPKEIEGWKVKLYQSVFKSEERKTIRKYLDQARRVYVQVCDERHAWDHLTCQGVAAMARSRYLIGSSLRWADGTPVMSREAFWGEPSALLERVMLEWARLRIEEREYRELARTDPWRTTWSVRKGESSLFGVPAADYTDEQRTMVGWSSLYDSVWEHEQRPTDEVVTDDDMLDGWLIVQRRKHEKELNAASAEGLIGNEKIRNSEEVFVVAQTLEDARKVESLNDETAASIKRRRMKYLAEKGEVREDEMPDTRQRINNQRRQMFMDAVKGGSGK